MSKKRGCWRLCVFVIALALWLVTAVAGCGKKAPPRVPEKQSAIETSFGSLYGGMVDTQQVRAPAVAARASEIDAAGPISGAVLPAGSIGKPAAPVLSFISGKRDRKQTGAAAS